MEEKSEKLLGSVTIPDAIIQDVKKNISHIDNFGKKIKEYISQDTTNLLGLILFGSITLQASDIHIEPQKDQTRLRVRLDGILQDVTSLESNIYHHLLSRLKLLSKLKLNITEKPQDGRFSIAIEDSLVEIRVSSLPSEWGESIVMRVLNPKNLLQLEALGLQEDLFKLLEKELKKTTGMILVAGPTGSGKTTTLYALLTKIQNPGIKIITIEDPIEYHLKDISQTQAVPEKGYSFSQGLMSIVRQDPDVILVGEMRDGETAKIAVQAALTGHLVLSTLHTNDAAGSIPRLVDLGVDTSSISSALRVVISQRLVRRVCKDCSMLIKPTSEELQEIKKELKGALLKNIDLHTLKIPKIKEGGCKQCNFIGHRERKGIFELFLIDKEMEKFILTTPPVSAVRELLVKKGMITIYQSGLIEVIKGETTLEEVQRVAEAD